MADVVESDSCLDTKASAPPDPNIDRFGFNSLKIQLKFRNFIAPLSITDD